MVASSRRWRMVALRSAWVGMGRVVDRKKETVKTECFLGEGGGESSGGGIRCRSRSQEQVQERKTVVTDCFLGRCRELVRERETVVTDCFLGRCGEQVRGTGNSHESRPGGGLIV